MLRTIGLGTSLAFLLVACGGGDPGAPTYTVGGTVTGLSGSGLVLQNESGDDLPLSASGGFTFATRLVGGASYSVTVKTAPISQFCGVANGAGTIMATDVTDVTVTCRGRGHRGGYAVSGLMGSALDLQNFTARDGAHEVLTDGNPPQITSIAPFTVDHVFPGNLPSATSIRTTQQPASPTQLCVIQNAGISLQAAAVTDVAVVCPRFSFSANAGDNTVSAYTVDATNGALAAVAAPVETGTSPHAIVGTQDTKYVFVANEGSNDISAFGVNSASGALTAVPGSPFAAGADPKALALYRVFGTYLYVANAGSDTVSAFAVDTSSGSLAPLSPATFATGKGPSAIAVDPTGGFIYVANNGGSNDISAFSVDPATGILTPVAGSPFPAGANPLDLALGAAGKFLYTANLDATNSSISGFNVNSGALTPLSGSPFPLAVSQHIATDRTGAYLYVTAGTGVVGYGIDRTTGMLTPLPGFPVAAGANAYSVVIDPTNQFLYVANDGAANISGFRLDASTGALTPMSGSPFPAGSHPEIVATF